MKYDNNINWIEFDTFSIVSSDNDKEPAITDVLEEFLLFLTSKFDILFAILSTILNLHNFKSDINLQYFSDKLELFYFFLKIL